MNHENLFYDADDVHQDISDFIRADGEYAEMIVDEYCLLSTDYVELLNFFCVSEGFHELAR